MPEVHDRLRMLQSIVESTVANAILGMPTDTPARARDPTDDEICDVGDG